MKHLITFVLLSLAMNTVYSQSKSSTGDFVIPNAGFETWYNVVVNATLNYDEIGTGPSDNWMSTLNTLASLPFSVGGPGPVTVFKSTDSYSGTYAAKGVSNIFPLGPITIFIPGMIGTAKMDMVGVRALLGQPCAGCRPSHLKGYYKFEPVNGDSCAAVILLSKWNSSAKKRDTIGYGKFVGHNAVSTYTNFDIPIQYAGTGTVDTMTLLVVSSAGFNVINFMGSVGQVGSTMYVDELSLLYPQVLNLGPDQTVFVGDTVTLDAGTFDTYSWSTGDHGKVVKIDTSGVGFGSKKIYCTVTGPDGTQSDTVMIYFRPRLGINDLQLDMHVTMMPNPVTNKQFTITANHSISGVEVISMVGEIVYSRSFTFDQKEVKVALNEIPGGVYQVRISYGDNQSVFKKIIIQ
ncbi:MAG: PCMD domain-containing protein [Bacteroidetes bacterium]|nr:PCMD domain-containing protein [Bacteroidota bacterium]